MAEQFNGSVNINSNIANVASQISSGLKKITNGFEDLAGLVEDLEKQNRQYAKSLGIVGTASDDAVKSVKKLNDELGDNSGVQRSKQNLANYVKTVNELRSALGKGTKPQGFFPDSASAISEIKELEGELLSLVNVYRTSFGKSELLRDSFTTQGAIQELEDFRQRIDQITREAFNGFENASQEVGGLRDVLSEVNNIGLRPSNAEVALANFQELRAEGNQLSDRIVEIQNQMRAVGPAASVGSKEAIQQMGELSQELGRAESRAGDLARELRGAMEEFGRQTGGANRTLTSLGFNPIRMEDIFPTSEQQKAKRIQEDIQRAAFNSIQEGAVRNALNTILRADRQLTSVDQNIISLTGHLPRLRYALYDVSNTFAIAGAGLIGFGAGIIKTSADFERAFADVERTVFNGTDKSIAQVEKLRGELIDLSTAIPVGFSDLADIATLAGQLNIAENRVASFTETVAKFSATTDVTIESAATAFGRLDQLVQGVDGQFEKLASSILAVGVNSVATESQIIAITGQISSIANIAGFTASELVGFSSALASVGTRPELARGTFTRLFTEIQQSVAAGDEQLQAFARTAGQSSDQFAAAWGAGSGADQIIAILEGLNAAGTDADRVLAELGITSVRDVPTLLKLAQSVDEVKRQIQIANIGFIEGIELSNQYSIIQSTVSSKLEVLSNSFQALIGSISDSTGGLSLFIDLMILALNAIRELIDNPITSTFLAIAAALSVVTGGMSLLASGALRATGSITGALTSLIEMETTIGVTTLAINGLNDSIGRAATSMGLFAGATEVATKEQAELGVQAGVTAGEINAQNVAAGGAGTNLGKLGGGLQKILQNSKLVKALGFARMLTGWGLAISGVIFAVKALGDQMGWWGEKTQEVNNELADQQTLMAAVQRDTEAYSKVTGDARENFILFNAEVANSNAELSDRGKVIAAVMGQEELYSETADGLTTIYEGQTFAIGENTKELLKQELALKLLKDANEQLFDIEKARLAQQRVASAEKKIADAEASPTRYTAYGSISSDSMIVGAEARAFDTFREQTTAALLAVIRDPQLVAGLKESGFDVSEWADAVVTGNTAVANSLAADLSPALGDLADQLQKTNPGLFREEIEMLRFAQEAGVDAITDYTAFGEEMIGMLKRAAFESAVFGNAQADAADETEAWRDALLGAFDEVYAGVNAQAQVESAVRSVGAAFADGASAAVVNGQEVQGAIESIIKAASSEEDAVAGLQGFYSALLEGGYASREELQILADKIIETYTVAAQAQLQLLRDQESALRSLPRLTGGVARELRSNREAQLAQEQAIQNIRRIGEETANSAKYAGYLANGYDEARQSASGTASAAKDIAENTQEAVKEVRTLLDYASDLKSVISRAFDIRFGAQSALDNITSGWQSLADTVNQAKQAVEELKASQDDLASDIAIKQYFLSVAEAYGDTLRAAQLRSEIADLEAKRLQQQAELEKAQSTTDNATALTGDSEQAIKNRAALSGLVSEYQDYITTLAESGASQDELRAATEQARQEFIQQALELGYQETVVLDYAKAFDDVRTAIDKVPRNITVDANVNPALQALNELNAKLQKSINKAKELNNQLGTKAEKLDIRDDNVFVESQSYGGLTATQVTILSQDKRGFASGGYTGPGGKYQPAGIVHKGEYVVPSQFVDQSRGLPNANFLAQLQNGMRGYANGGFVGGGGMGDGTMMVELSPYDRKLLADAGNVQLRVNGKLLAETTNANNYNQARRGSN